MDERRMTSQEVSEAVTRERGRLMGAIRALGDRASTVRVTDEGWTTKDMAAHVYVREHRPDAALGVLPLGPLSAYTERVMASTRS